MANELKESLKYQIKSKLRKLNKGNREKVINKKQPTWLYPFAKEEAYSKKIKELFNPITILVVEILLNKLSAWNNEIKRDAWFDELNDLLNSVRKSLQDLFGDNPFDFNESTEFIFNTAVGINEFIRFQWNKQANSATGMDFDSDEDFFEDIKNGWAQENFTTLKGLGDEYVKKINNIVSNGLRDGLRVEEIRDKIRQLNSDMFGYRRKKNGKRTLSRAEIIARDQVGKLNGLITKARMQEAGIDKYIWQTSLDERVRGNPAGAYPRAVPSHFIMEGTINKWDNSNVYALKSDIDSKTGKITSWRDRTGKMPKVIPGTAILCRCSAIPYWNEIMSEVNVEL
jgi:hypothetical protein